MKLYLILLFFFLFKYTLYIINLFIIIINSNEIALIVNYFNYYIR